MFLSRTAVTHGLRSRGGPNKMRQKIFLALFFLFFPFFVLAASPTTFPISKAGAGLKEYLPGDIVHIIVSAPFDTRSITATMPDNTEVKLVHDRRSNIWQGFWQVPIYSKKGNYYAQLKALDLENNLFEGQTNYFFIGELNMINMITLIGKPSNEAEKAAREVAPPKPKPKPKPKTKVKTRKVKFIAAESPVDPNLTKAQKATVAHFYLEKQDYIKAREQLKSMLKTEPGNHEVKRLLNRVEIMIKIDKEGSTE